MGSSRIGADFHRIILILLIFALWPWQASAQSLGGFSAGKYLLEKVWAKNKPSAFLSLCQNSDLEPTRREFLHFLSPESRCEQAYMDLRRIELLYLGPNDPVEWGVLGELVNLRDLAIESRSFVDLQFAAGLRRLELLVLSGPFARGKKLDLRPLFGLAKLRMLRLQGVDVDVISLQRLQQSNPRLRIELNAARGEASAYVFAAPEQQPQALRILSHQGPSP